MIQSSKTILSKSSNYPLWSKGHIDDVLKNISNKDYPCFFAREALESGTLYINFYEEEKEDLFIKELTEFLELDNTNDNNHLFALISIFNIDKMKSIDDYNQYFWDFLQRLHYKDKHDWPLEYTKDINDFKFEYCFASKRVFVFATCPLYIRKKSRVLCETLAIIFVPLSSFKKIRMGTKAGTKSRDIIRRKLENYDGEKVSKEFGNADGSDKPRAWKAYFIDDNGNPFFKSPPLIIK